MTHLPKLSLPLLLTRLSIFAFLLPWQLMRFSKPEAAKGVATKYYKTGGLPDVAFTVIAVFMMALLIAFLLGFKKRISYGLVFLLHAVGTIMAMFLLYRLRESDTISLDSFLAKGK